MNEAETRAEYIDPKLKTVGWGVVEGLKAHVKNKTHSRVLFFIAAFFNQ